MLQYALNDTRPFNAYRHIFKKTRDKNIIFFATSSKLYSRKANIAFAQCGKSPLIFKILSTLLMTFNPLTAGVAYIRVMIFYIKYHILNMLKNKCDINQQDLKRVDLHVVRSE